MKWITRYAEFLVVSITVTAVLLVIASGASAHRVVSSSYAQKSANNYVRYNYCGGYPWHCTGVFVPLVRCGYHSYCWNGTSHQESVFVWSRLRQSSGTVNGHTGKVTGYGER